MDQLNRDRINFDGMPAHPFSGDFSATTLDKTRPAVARHYLRHWEASKTPHAAPAAPVQAPDIAMRPRHSSAVDEASAGQLPVAADASQRLEAGHAITLRATDLMVLRIAHGRVWVTLTDVGPWSRVLAGDHFLSRGDSLTLLPGQSLVMESFSADPAASARFTWAMPGVCAPQPAPEANLRANIREPWLDLRHAVGLALGAAGRLLHGLGAAGSAALAPVLTPFAMIFVAASAHDQRASGTFDALKGDSGAPCRS